MKRREVLFAIFMLAAAACSPSAAVPPPVDPDEPNKPDEPVKTEPLPRPDFNEPYVYDPDDGFDSAAYLAAYTGTPYKSVHAIPGAIEAEDFDKGDNNAAYYRKKTDQPARGGYRDGHTVGIRPNGGASNGFFIGDVQNGEWLAYTIEVAQDGSYEALTTIVSADAQPAAFYFEVDGRGASRPTAAAKGEWEDFSHSVKSENIQLTKGRHVLRYCATGAGNVDRFVFTRTGDLNSSTGGSTYPITAKMSNPLFVDLPSPMYNSWLTGNLYTADASAHVWTIDGEERLYLYASHDIEPAQGCDRMDRYHVFSTTDMTTWTDHGEILNAATVRKHVGWGSDGFMWAPDCAYNPADKLYYFYFPHPESNETWTSSWRIGVAVSPYPDREFRVIGHIAGMPPHIDPCVFVDNDGQPYIYNGGGGKCFGGKLRKDDWAMLDGEMKPMTGLAEFHEATWVHRAGNKYYLSHSDNNNPRLGGNRMRYAMSDSPLGPWKDMGVYMYPTGMETNHGSIVRFKGRWWAFYHTSNYSGHGALRSVCVDEIELRSDGKYGVVRNWGTVRGGSAAPKFTPGTALTVEAEAFNDGGYHYGYFKRSSRAAKIGTVSGGGRTYIENLAAGDWVRYTFESTAAGVCAVECALSPKAAGSRILLSVNGSHPDSDGVAVSGTVGQWCTVSMSGLSVAAGENYLEFRVVGGSVDADNFVIK